MTAIAIALMAAMIAIALMAEAMNWARRHGCWPIKAAAITGRFVRTWAGSAGYMQRRKVATGCGVFIIRMPEWRDADGGAGAGGLGMTNVEKFANGPPAIRQHREKKLACKGRKGLGLSRKRRKC